MKQFFREYFYWSFRRAHTISRWFSRRYSPGGKLLVIGVLSTLAFGFNTNANLAYQIFSVLFVLHCLADVGSRFLKVNLKFQRKLPRYGTVNQPLTYRVEISNLSSRTESGLRLLDLPRNPWPSLTQYLHAKINLEKTDDWVSRRTGYHRWQQLLKYNITARIQPQDLPDIGPGQTRDIRFTIEPTRRGRLELEAALVSKSDPLGMINRNFTLERKDSTLILPKLYPLPPIVLPGSRKHQPGGVSLASSVGDSEEFHALRDYRPGDPLKHIHWKSWAKTGTPVVKEYQEEYFIRYALILDTFSHAVGEPVFEEAVSLAASIVHTMHDRDSLLDLMFVGPKAYCFTSGRSLGHREKMLEILAAVDVCLDQDFDALLPLIGERYSLLSACVCVFIDWDEHRQSLVRLLKNFRIPVKVLLVIPPHFDGPLRPDPSLSGADFFVRLEAGKIEEGLHGL